MCPGPNQSTCLILMCLRRMAPAMHPRPWLNATQRALARPYNSPVGSPRPIFSSQCKVIARTDVVSSSSSLAASTLLPLSPVCHRPAHTPSHQFIQSHRNDRRERRSLKTMNYEIRQNKIAALDSKFSNAIYMSGPRNVSLPSGQR